MIDLVRDNLAQIEELCRRHGVRRLFLIGSALGDRFTDESDVDFLVDLGPRERRGFDDVYFLLLEDLTQLLKRPVDLIDASCLRNPYLIASINRTKQVLYAA